jgi:DNA-binding transcriptional LysR family regulator
MKPANRFHVYMNAVHDTDSVSTERLAALDLNLVVAFDALARERNVTRAAQRMGVTQSAMSHALGRLRELLADPLLVRSRGGMVLTPCAESLVVPLRSGLVTIGRALGQPSRFEAKSARRAFCIASPDLFDVLAIPPLLERIREDAPGVDMAVVPADPRRLSDQLETGEVDIAVVPQIDGLRSEQPTGAESSLVRRKLLRDGFTCFVRVNHPCLFAQRGRRRKKAAHARLSLASYVALPHALVSPTGEGRGFVDQILEQRGLRRRIALRVPHFYSALAIVAKSELILTAPTALSRLASADLPVVALPPPLPLPKHNVNLVWHERFSNDAGHQWLRELVADVARQIQNDA